MRESDDALFNSAVCGTKPPHTIPVSLPVGSEIKLIQIYIFLSVIDYILKRGTYEIQIVPRLKILAPFGCVAGRAGARDGRVRGVRRARRARRTNLGMEVGEEPVAGGGESITS